MQVFLVRRQENAALRHQRVMRRSFRRLKTSYFALCGFKIVHMYSILWKI